MNRTRFRKEDHLPNWERRDNEVTKGDRVQSVTLKNSTFCPRIIIMCFYGSQSKEGLLSSTAWGYCLLIAEMERVYCAMSTGRLN